MKTLIIYASRHGCARRAAEKIGEAFGDGVEICDVRQSAQFKLDQFERVIIGGSIHIGKIQSRIRNYIEKNLAQLLEKQVGLFICHMAEAAEAEQEFTNAYPQQLIEHAAAIGLFGGEFNFEKMNFVEKYMIKKVGKVTESVSRINEDNIADFIAKMRK
jgi:menaquinone-dependent protoporphyrinogen oxidase